MGKQLILILLAFGLLMLASNESQIIQVVIVVPPELVPYYEWLLSFPGWMQPDEKPPSNQPVRNSYKPVTIPHQVVTASSSSRNQPAVRSR